ncbi:MAG: rhomboid family intramembrane serine protease [Phycisphaeraceae bacterium]|nr:rhomboid family intramembrane serine protease [Phycisphaeraceae bacterium]
MFFPTRTDRRINRTPWVNYALIAANVLLFLFTERLVNANDYRITQFYLSGDRPQFLQFLTYQFLHGGKMHILFNMLFLYVFGNAVEDRLGRLGYLLFYLAGGVISGLGHCLVSAAPVLGASGSIAAVTGAYLALFPMTNVTIVYWFFFIGSFEVSSMLLILFQVAQNLLFQVTGAGENVAYMAHLAGYVTGFAVGMGLLFSRLIPREPYDMLSMIAHRRRRAQFQRLTQQGYHPWDSAPAPGRIGGAPATNDKNSKLETRNSKLLDARDQIAASIDHHDLPAAARLYGQLLEQHGDQVLSQQQQLDVANQLMSEGRYDTAAAAYELFLKTYPRYSELQHVQLILGLIHGRYLDSPKRARELLEAALPKLSADDQQLAKSVLDELGK